MIWGVKDTGTAESADDIAEVRRLENEYFGNGQLHIVNAETGALIARKDAYLPQHVFESERCRRGNRALEAASTTAARP